MAEKHLKLGWKIWRFEQMATNINVRIDNPSESGMEHYVGLEHLDPDSLRIRRWGSPNDVEATKLCFKKGDIIFARRRAYQRKLGVAEFDGICSAHAMVLRAKPEVVLPEFLPFFMQSDLFMNRAVEISVGSLSPTINWKAMAVQEFALPPVQDQRKIVRQVEALDALMEDLGSALRAGESLVGSVLAEMTDRTECTTTTLDQISGLVTDGDHNPPKRQASGVPHLVVANISENDGYNFDGCTFISETDFERVKKRYTPTAGDIIITCVGSIGRVAIVDGRTKFSADRSLAIVRPLPDRLIPEYGFFLMKTPRIQRQFSHSSIGTAQAHLYLKELRSIKVQLPSIREQETQLSVLREISASIARLRARRLDLGLLRKVTINLNEGYNDHVH